MIWSGRLFRRARVGLLSNRSRLNSSGPQRKQLHRKPNERRKRRRGKPTKPTPESMATSQPASPHTGTEEIEVYSRRPTLMRAAGATSLFQIYTSATWLGNTVWHEGWPSLASEITAFASAEPTLFTFPASFLLFSVLLTTGVWQHNRHSIIRAAVVPSESKRDVKIVQYSNILAVQFDVMSLMRIRTHRVPMTKLVPSIGIDAVTRRPPQDSPLGICPVPFEIRLRFMVYIIAGEGSHKGPSMRILPTSAARK